MSAPVIIDPINYSELTETRNGPPGPASSGGNLYCIVGTPGAQRVFKSTDSGATWTDLVSVPGAGDLFYTVSLNRQRIWFINASQALTYFDAASETFGPTVPTPNAGSSELFSITESANGYLHVSYSTIANLWYSFFDGSAFSTPAHLITITHAWDSTSSITQDNDTNIHIVSNEPNSSAFADTALVHWQFSQTGGVLSGKTTIDATPAGYGTSAGGASGDSIILPVITVLASGHSEVGAYIGTPAASPSWSFTSLASASSAVFAAITAIRLTPSSALMCYTDAAGALRGLVFTGASPGVASVIYDSTATPPTPPVSAFKVGGATLAVSTTSFVGVLFEANLSPDLSHTIAYFVPFAIPNRATSYCFGS